MNLKKLFVFVCINLFSINGAFSQISSQNKKDVFETKNIIFYGYDFSNFQFADPKRIGQDLKKHIFILTAFLVEQFPEKEMAKLQGKENIVFNFQPTIDVNKKIKNEDIVTPIKHIINKDSLQSLVNRYIIIEKSGIGQVVFFECFDDNSKTVSAYSVFFDISTRKILHVLYSSKYDKNSFNRLSDWNTPSIMVIKELSELLLNKVNEDVSICKKWKLIALNGDSLNLEFDMIREYFQNGKYTYTKTYRKNNKTENGGGTYILSPYQNKITLNTNKGDVFTINIELKENTLLIKDKNIYFYREE